MINQLIQQLYSINIKLFLWFWLIAIISIVSTQFISEQLAQDALILAPHPNDQQKLYNAANKIRRNKPTNVAQFIKELQKNKNSSFLVKNIDNSTVFPRLSR